ncbi:insulinase family protein [Thalassotalea atypica]|uniref:insulinase family protein n=1 Tax=Thalassotalea atypica TaxID=2054316 RepID=UPI002572DFD8|nr:insulinase family protein [Thalassotalea atypica]
MLKQSPNDHKCYKAITLPNGLRVLLVENNESDQAAAALAVNAGHFNDPKDRQGLAHFVEHMLFLGTHKYPDGSEYQKFISQYGGHNNAWTGTEHTCYFFDIQHKYFDKALDRFSRFFIEPLLSKEFVKSERQNIDAEFKLKLKDDIRRLYDVHKETINQAHPFAQFSVGNIDTLADNERSCVQEDVVAFFKKYYCSTLMTLAVEGPFSLKHLQELVEHYFSDISDKKQPQPTITESLYLPEHLAKEIFVTPVKNDRQLIISFAMPSIDEYYRHKPESVLAYLLGHEGPGSLLSLFKKNHWAMGLTAGSGINGSNFKDFNISIRLTEAGEQHTKQIIEAVFSYIKLLNDKPIAEFYYQEKNALSELSFQYQEKLKPLDSVSQLVTNMQHYPVEDYIYGDYVMTGLCQTSINRLLTFLAPKNCRIIRVGQEFETDKTSFWYQVPYRQSDISPTQLSHWENIDLHEELQLPAKNSYIIRAPKVYPHKEQTLLPEVIYDHDGLKVWFKQDTTFKVPKGYMYIGIDSPISVASIENIAMTRLFVELYTDSVIEKHYDAELAGIHYHLYSHQGGMTLQLSGICANQPKLLEKLLADIQHFDVPVQRFELIKVQLLEHWRNADKSKSISQLFSTLSSLMQPNNPPSSHLYDALNAVTFEKFCDYSTQLFKQITIDALIHGNWLKDQATNIAYLLDETFKNNHHAVNQVQCPVIDISDLNEILVPVHMPKHDHAAVIYYPNKDKDLKSTALIMLVSHLLAPLFFEEMRTEKQYGYLVNVGYVPINRYPGLAFYIQSPNIKPEKLVSEMNLFIEHWRSKVANIPEQQWSTLKEGLAGQLMEKDSSLRIKSQRFWGSICNQDNEFDHKKKMIEAITKVQRSDLEHFIADNQKLTTVSGYQNRVTLVSSEDNIDDFSVKSQLKGKIIENCQKFTVKCKRKF